jgi:hypothetical protein
MAAMLRTAPTGVCPERAPGHICRSALAEGRTIGQYALTPDRSNADYVLATDARSWPTWLATALPVGLAVVVVGPVLLLFGSQTWTDLTQTPRSIWGGAECLVEALTIPAAAFIAYRFGRRRRVAGPSLAWLILLGAIAAIVALYVFVVSWIAIFGI